MLHAIINTVYPFFFKIRQIHLILTNMVYKSLILAKHMTYIIEALLICTQNMFCKPILNMLHDILNMLYKYVCQYIHLYLTKPLSYST